MTYKTEFPHYDDTLTLPDGWVDTSWHNDVCPSFEKFIGNTTFRLWCDFKDPEMREVGGRRFTVTHDFEEEGFFEPIGQFDTLEEALSFIEKEVSA
jgi:hypothetical protein